MKRFVVKLGLEKKDVPAKIEFGYHVHDNMDGNANFTTPAPTLVEVKKVTDDLQSAYNDSLGGSFLSGAVLDEQEQAFDEVIKALRDYVNSVARGSEAIIKSAGMETRKQSEHHAMVQVTGVIARKGKNTGEMIITWDKVPGCRLFLGYLKADGDGQYVLKIKTTRTRVTVSGLAVGVTYWIQMEACGSSGSGSLSEPVSAIPQY